MVVVQPQSATLLTARRSRLVPRRSLFEVLVPRTSLSSPFAFPRRSRAHGVLVHTVRFSRFSAMRLEPRLARERSVAHPSRDFDSVPLAFDSVPLAFGSVASLRSAPSPARAKGERTRRCITTSVPIDRASGSGGSGTRTISIRPDRSKGSAGRKRARPYAS